MEPVLVAATAQQVDFSSPAERGKLLGFNDLLSALLGAGRALAGGFALESLGVVAWPWAPPRSSPHRSCGSAPPGAAPGGGRA